MALTNDAGIDAPCDNLLGASASKKLAHPGYAE